VHFATYNARIDRLTVLKTTFPEELQLTTHTRADAPLLISAVAFRGAVRSEARYVVSGAPALTGGTGFMATLSLMARFGERTCAYGCGGGVPVAQCGGSSSTFAACKCLLLASSATRAERPRRP
jgi:hypothetical protein